MSPSRLAGLRYLCGVRRVRMVYNLMLASRCESLVRDQDWRLFKPPPKQERQELVAPAVAAC